MDRIQFRVVMIHSEEAAKYRVRKLRQYHIEPYDLLEASFVADEEIDFMDEDAYIICCAASVEDYLRYKEIFKLEEIIYEGIRTLIQ